jgi:hypothetical protein
MKALEGTKNNALHTGTTVRTKQGRMAESTEEPKLTTGITRMSKMRRWKSTTCFAMLS